MESPSATEGGRMSNSGDGQEGDSDNAYNLERKGSVQSNPRNGEVSLSAVVFHRGNDENPGSTWVPPRGYP